MHGWIPAAGDGEAIGHHVATPSDRNRLYPLVAFHIGYMRPFVDREIAFDCGVVPAVDIGRDAYSGVGQIERRAEGVIIVAKDRDPFAGGHAKPVHITAYGAGHHHAGAVIVAKGHGALHCASRVDTALGGDAPEGLHRRVARIGDVVRDALNSAVGAAVIGPSDGGPAHHADVFHGLQLGQALRGPSVAGHSCDLVAFEIQPPAKPEILVAQDYVRARARSGQRCHDPRRARANDKHVTKRVGFLVILRVAGHGQPAQSGGAADDGLVEFFPKRFGPHEGLVIEPSAEEGRQQIICLKQIPVERPPVILRAGV